MMFFLFSKLLSFLLQPMNVLFVLVVLLSLTYLVFKWERISRTLLKLIIVISLIVGYYPIPEYLLGKLEAIHPPQVTLDYSMLTGVVVLGGATRSGIIAEERDQVTLGEEVERMVEATHLFRINPDLKILFTGFSSEIFHEGWSAANIAEKFFLEQGIPSDNLILEGRSRNTYENAVYSKEHLEKELGKWGLITSANHMPRSVKIFNKAGLGEQIVPIPVDYRVAKTTEWAGFSLDRGNDLWKTYLHEIVGTIVYKLTGKI